MPRHRAERLHRNRAKRQGIWPGRSLRPVAVKMRLAGGAAGGTARQRRLAADALHGRRARSFAGFGRAARRPGRRSARAGSGMEYGRIVRGAMLTPWFAVSVGLVVAIS